MAYIEFGGSQIEIDEDGFLSPIPMSGQKNWPNTWPKQKKLMKLTEETLAVDQLPERLLQTVRNCSDAAQDHQGYRDESSQNV